MTVTATPSTPRGMDSLPGPRPLPLLGNTLEMKPTSFHLVLEDWARRYGEIYRCHMGPRPVVVLSNPEVIRKVLIDRPATFRRLRNLEKVMEDMNLLGVFPAEGETWRRQRKLLNPGFQATHLETFYPSLSTITQRLRGVMELAAKEAHTVDVLPLIMRYTVDVTCIVSFGLDLNTVEKGSDTLQLQLEQIFAALQHRVVAPFPYWKLLPGTRPVDRALAATRKVMLEIIDSARKAMEREPERAKQPRTLLEAMLVAQDEESDGARLTDDEVIANVVILLLGGEDTTANTITWMLHYLASMPEMQARARQEVDSVLGTETVPTSAHLKRLPYVAGVTQEALRLRSPVPTVLLETNEDTVIDQVAVPAGTMVFCLTRPPCLNNSLFGDAEHFRPERWLPEPPPDTLPHTPRLMMPFGAGSRICPGRSLGLLECALVASTVLRHFELEVVDPNAPVREVNTFTVQPDGVRLRFRQRAST
ncbi:cytochrome P450 [Hyalangium rubrum]|uniref:Cytochrome P450 n=1 Tax=Hyalangium rubrum TaxID=3103134 RepID=A0ABU5GVI8_9BACT|nr:cytochrome P450 [Hyalangium sp. s54d21]MDY7225203.1 cytochrome P450 [Hyalangium sp. s54d21]